MNTRNHQPTRDVLQFQVDGQLHVMTQGMPPFGFPMHWLIHLLGRGFSHAIRDGLLFDLCHNVSDSSLLGIAIK